MQPLRRRARDRIADRAGTSAVRRELEHDLYFIDEDLRRAAALVGNVEGYLVRALDAVERMPPSAESLREVAREAAVPADLEELGDLMEELRRRMFRVARTLAEPEPPEDRRAAEPVADRDDAAPAAVEVELPAGF